MSFITSRFRFQLTALDFDSLIREARRYAKQLMPNWDFDSPVDIGRFALDIYLRAQAQQIEIANGWAQEAFLSACRLRSSAIAHAVSRGYTPRNPTPSLGTVNIEFASQPTPVTYPQFTLQLSTRNLDSRNPIFFENAASFTVPANTTLLQVPFAAGTTQTQSYTGTGLSDQAIQLQQKPAINNFTSITDDLDNSWTLPTSGFKDFVNSSPTDKHFVPFILSDGTTQLLFGDDTNGATIPEGTVLTIKYRVGGGITTNVQPGSIKTVETNPQPITITQCTNLLPFTGGDDEESIDSIKRNAAKEVRQRRRLSRIEEVNDFIQAQPGALRAFSFLEGGTVTSHLIPVGGYVPSIDLKNAIKDAVNERLIMGYTSQVVDPIYIPPTISVTFTTHLGYDSNETQNTIKQAILTHINPTTQVTIDDKLQFARQNGQTLRISEITAILEDFRRAGAIEPDYIVNFPLTDIPIDQTQIFTNIDATVTATSRNILAIQYS